MSIRLILLALSGPLAVWLIAYPLGWSFTRYWFGDARPAYWGIITAIFIVPPLIVRYLTGWKALLIALVWVHLTSALAFMILGLAYKYNWTAPDRLCGFFTCNFYAESFSNIFTLFFDILSTILVAVLMAWRRWGTPVFDRVLSSYSTRARAEP